MEEHKETRFTDKVICALIIAFGAILSAWILGSAINSPQPETDYTDVARWTLMGSIEGGYNVFDSATGRICSVPNGNVADFNQVVCSPPPEKN